MATMPDNERVNNLYERLYGDDARGATQGERRHQVQQLIYIEDACKDMLQVIAELDALDNPEDGVLDNALAVIKNQFHFLRRLTNDKQYLNSFDYLASRR